MYELDGYSVTMRREEEFEGETEWVLEWNYRRYHLKVGSFIQLHSGDIFEVGYVEGYIITTTQNIDIHIDAVESVLDSEQLAHIGFLLAEEGVALAPDPVASDPVNHPSHYTQGRFETIEVIEEWTKHYSNGYTAYCVGNTMKYVARAPHKHASPLEDLKKARTYLDFAIRQLEDSEGE